MSLSTWSRPRGYVCCCLTVAQRLRLPDRRQRSGIAKARCRISSIRAFSMANICTITSCRRAAVASRRLARSGRGAVWGCFTHFTSIEERRKEKALCWASWYSPSSLMTQAVRRFGNSLNAEKHELSSGSSERTNPSMMVRYFNGLFWKSPFLHRDLSANGSLLATSSHMLNSSIIIELFASCFNRLGTRRSK